jgi:hypothetical protein
MPRTMIESKIKSLRIQLRSMGGASADDENQPTAKVFRFRCSLLPAPGLPQGGCGSLEKTRNEVDGSAETTS